MNPLNKIHSILIANEKAIRFLAGVFIFLWAFIVLFSITAPNLTENKNKFNQSICPDEKEKIDTAFHSFSGFNLTKNISNSNLKYTYGVDHFLNVLSNQIIMLDSYKPFNRDFSYLTREEILSRDKFSWITPLFRLSTPRIFELDEFILKKYDILFSIFSTGGGFFISPFNLKLNPELGMIVIPPELLKEGYNNFPICKLR